MAYGYLYHAARDGTARTHPTANVYATPRSSVEAAGRVVVPAREGSATNSTVDEFVNKVVYARRTNTMYYNLELSIEALNIQYIDIAPKDSLCFVPFDSFECLPVITFRL